MSFPDPPDSFATRGFGVTGGSTSLSLVLTLWGRISKARDMLGQREGGNQRSLISQILPPRCFQPFGAEPSSSSELRCQNSHKDLSDPQGMGAACSASRTVGCLRGEAGLGSHLPAGRGEAKNRSQHFFRGATPPRNERGVPATESGTAGPDVLGLDYGSVVGNIKHQGQGHLDGGSSLSVQGFSLGLWQCCYSLGLFVLFSLVWWWG